jgi:hypothetical protein
MTAGPFSFLGQRAGIPAHSSGLEPEMDLQKLLGSASLETVASAWGTFVFPVIEGQHFPEVL